MPANINTLTVVDLVPFGLEREHGGFYALRLSRPNWADWTPGQFVMIRPETWGPELPWARPLSICMLSADLILFFQIVGRGSKRLAELRHGDKVQVVGPLGTGFQVEKDTPTLLLAGGMGIVPFVGYVQRHPGPNALSLLFGHRAPLEYYPFEHFDDKVEARHFHEAGPEDLTLFLNTVDERVASYAARNGLVLACGPLPFLRAVQGMCLKHKARAQLSLESRMACGAGACLGCVVKPLLDEASGRNRSAQDIPEQMHKGLPVPTCTCGPVFWADSIDLKD
ncbi:MAG: dihydroorotate dehydrogenase electron transfer subunit [Deltaproteobacteria bacterium]|jgi:dihydroorotate dehydrogenase electron transfer subunit|nr:dihydroorotate dehydrogenase electron transfer subunit [Deltaproteobacteria bacterium]